MSTGGERPRQQSAVALAYQSGDAAPRVVAKGQGLVAEQIIARAHDAGVYLHESKELVALLMQVDLDRHIPPSLYRAIAELLAWLYHIESTQQSEGAPLPDVPTLAQSRERTAGPDGQSP
jgi:flagellar biosynthesis protein